MLPNRDADGNPLALDGWLTLVIVWRVATKKRYHATTERTSLPPQPQPYWGPRQSLPRPQC